MYLDHQSLLYLIYISTIAGLATTAGCIIVIFLGKPPERLLAFLLAGAGGVMIAVVSLDLIPLALTYKQPKQFILGLTLGIIFMWIADKLLKARYRNVPRNRFNRLKRTGILVASGIALHDIPEGMAIAVGQESTTKLGMLIAISIALHNIPEGMATATPLLMAGIRKKKILTLTLAIALFTPMGAILGKVALGLVSLSLSFFLALAAGAMTFLVLTELWPLSIERHPFCALLGGIGGFIFFLMVLTVLPH